MLSGVVIKVGWVILCRINKIGKCDVSRARSSIQWDWKGEGNRGERKGVKSAEDEAGKALNVRPQS